MNMEQWAWVEWYEHKKTDLLWEKPFSALWEVSPLSDLCSVVLMQSVGTKQHKGRNNSQRIQDHYKMRSVQSTQVSQHRHELLHPYNARCRKLNQIICSCLLGVQWLVLIAWHSTQLPPLISKQENTVEFLRAGCGYSRNRDTLAAEENNPKTRLLPLVTSSTYTDSMTILCYLNFTEPTVMASKDCKMSKQGTAGKRKH